MIKRSTKGELEKRISEVQQRILDGYSRSEIVQFGSKWEVSDRQIDDYISSASDHIKEFNKITLRENMAIITAQFWSLFRSARSAGNISEQRHILMSLAKLKGICGESIECEAVKERPLQHLTNKELNDLLLQTA